MGSFSSDGGFDRMLFCEIPDAPPVASKKEFQFEKEFYLFYSKVVDQKFFL